MTKNGQPVAVTPPFKGGAGVIPKTPPRPPAAPPPQKGK